MRNGKRLFKTNGDIVISSLPHNQKASEKYTQKTLNERSRLESLVEKLLREKSILLSLNGINLNLRVDGKYVYTSYFFEDGGESTECTKFDSLFANNEPRNELLLTIAAAECNAELTDNSKQITLYQYPAIGFLVAEPESKSLKFRLRKAAKHPFFYRFR